VARYERTSFSLADIPALSDRQLKLIESRGRLPRRSFLVRTAQAGMGLGLGYVALVAKSAPANAANDGFYFRDYTSISSGPCTSYASNHTEEGIKCGPSAVCTDQSCCYEPSAGVPSGDVKANTTNARSWHRWDYGQGGWYQRPDECWGSGASGSDYDSWRWRFGDGTIYSCSDGVSCLFGTCYNSICPWPRAG
jgi:hypothetical protein